MAGRRATMFNKIFRTRHMCVPQGERERKWVSEQAARAVCTFLARGICKTLFEMAYQNVVFDSVLSAKMAGRHKPKVLECSDGIASCTVFNM